MDGMFATDPCAATMAHSDNTALNLLLKLPNGPQGLTLFTRSIGDASIRAGVPARILGDKTNRGGCGTTNDIDVLWSAEGQALIPAIYLTNKTQSVPTCRDATATRLIVEYWQMGKPQ